MSNNNTYALYLKERENIELIETNYGFATYSIVSKNEIYIQDIYVKKSFRCQKLAHKLADICIKHYETTNNEKVTTIYGSVDLKANNPEPSTKTILSYGFKYHNIENNSFIYFKKELK